jgi:hypothetical protein
MSLHDVQQATQNLRSVQSNIGMVYERLSVVYAKRMANVRGADIDEQEIETEIENATRALDLIAAQLDIIERKIDGDETPMESDLGGAVLDWDDDPEPFEGQTDVSDHVQRTQARADTAAEYTCDLPGCQENGFGTLYGLTSHRRDDHDV